MNETDYYGFYYIIIMYKIYEKSYMPCGIEVIRNDTIILIWLTYFFIVQTIIGENVLMIHTSCAR